MRGRSIAVTFDPLILTVMFLLSIPCVVHGETRSGGAISDAFVSNGVREQLSAYPGVAVSAKNGVVALDGAVGTVNDMDRVLRLAREVDGVHGIRNFMTLPPASRGGSSPAGTGESGSDLALRHAVLAALQPYRDVTITVRNGTVILSGRVDSEAAKAEVAAQAVRVTGVTSVNDTLRVQQPDLRTEEDIAQDQRTAVAVRRAIESDARLEARNIRVSGREGVMFLTGDVPDTTRIRLAGEQAARVKGVARVINRLTII